MGLNVLSLFDGMSCGRLALERAGIDVDNYIASEVKDFAINHTLNKYPDTILAGDVTKLHYENNKLYRDCSRWAVIDNIYVLNNNDFDRNYHLIKKINDIYVIDIVNCIFLALDKDGKEMKYDFDKHNQLLADYKSNGLLVDAKNINNEELEYYKSKGFIDLYNGELVIWEFEDNNCVFEGPINMLIGGSPCQDFSFASSTNGGKYGLEGSKSRLFFDYIRLRLETNPEYFFLENVAMKKESKDALDTYMGVNGIRVNSNLFSIQQRRRIYWTNIVNNKEFFYPDIEERLLNFQNYKIVTLPYIENKIFRDTRREFRKSNNDNKLNNIVKEINALLFNTEIDKIIKLNKWAYDEYILAYPNATKRDFINELHYQLCEVQVQKTPSRDKMYYIQCKNVTNESRISCITRKQDRQNNSGNVDFGNYYRFLTRFELCKGQTVPYHFLNDLSLSQIEDVCGDGWTVDVISHFFSLLPREYHLNDSDLTNLNLLEEIRENIINNGISNNNIDYNLIYRNKTNIMEVNNMDVNMEDKIIEQNNEDVLNDENTPKKRNRRPNRTLDEKIALLESKRIEIEDELKELYARRDKERKEKLMDLLLNSNKDYDEIAAFLTNKTA